jgi:predicted metal-dependent hydrolase
VGEPGEPVLTAEERAAFERGVREFNEGCYFECHDTLEDLWAGLRGDARDFFQGLIQVSVGYYHLGNQNRAGAASMFERALRRFENYPLRYFGFDLERQRRALQELLARLAHGGPDDEPAPPQWRFDAGASAAP